MQPELPDLLTGAPLGDYDPQDVREAGDAIRDYCGWHIAPAISTTLTFPVTSRRGYIYLPTLQLNSVTSVTIDDRLLSVSEYEVWTGRKARIDIGRIYLPSRAVIVFNHGYSEP